MNAALGLAERRWIVTTVQGVYALCSRLGLAFLMAAAPAGALAQDRPENLPNPAASTRESAGATAIFAEPHVIARGIDAATRMLGDGSDIKNGFYTELSNMPTGAGWITAGPGYRHWFFGDQLYVDGSAAISWRAYKMGQARFELPQLARSRLAIGTHVRWQDLTQVTFFGDGPESLETNRSEYRLKSTNISGYATVRPFQWLAVRGLVGWLDRPSVLPPAGSFQRGNPATEDVFSSDPVFSLEVQPSFGYREASVTVDTRDHRSHPTSGGVYRAALTGFTDQDHGTFSVRRTEAEGAHFIPVSRSRVVLALHGWLAASDTAADATVPFYLQPSLGGHNTLRGYTDYRFHDRNLLAVNVEARFALFTHVDAAVFADAGNVAAHVSELDIDKRSYGVGWRVHSRESTFARLDLAHGAEGWNFLFRLSDPLHLSRITRRLAPVPFVP
jgi:Omp85 superfamily domain